MLRLFSGITKIRPSGASLWASAILLLALSSSLLASGASITLAWDAPSDGNVAGYKVHFGASTGGYTDTVDAGIQTTVVLPNLAYSKTYYFAVSTYSSDGLESDLSNEVAAATPSAQSLVPYGAYSGDTISGTGADVFLSLAVSPSKVFTGRALINGTVYSLAGRFNRDGKATITARPIVPGAPKRTLELQLDSGSPTISVTVDDSAGPISLTVSKSPFSAANPTPDAKTYTMRIGPLTPDVNSTSQTVPGGWGFAQVVVNKAGRVRIVGRLADTQAFSSVALLKGDRHFPLCATIRTDGAEILAGEIAITENPGVNDGEGSLAWTKLTGRGQGIYRNSALDGTVKAELSVFKPYKPRLLPKTTFSATLAGGDLPSPNDPMTRDVQFQSGNPLAVRSTGAERLQLLVNPANGLISGSFIHPANGRASAVRGVVFQKQASGGGDFMAVTTTGALDLSNVPAPQ